MLDVDSTLCSVEGIDWLAALRGPDVRASVASVTDRAMRGEISLESIYSARLELVRPTRTEVDALGAAYVMSIVPGAVEVVADLIQHGVRVVIVSGGIRQAVVPLARTVGIADADVHAVELEFASDGSYAGFDASSPLARTFGKPALVRSLSLAAPSLAVGDGSTDAELKTVLPAAVDAFAAFVGVVARPTAVDASDYVIERFTQLQSLVLK